MPNLATSVLLLRATTLLQDPTFIRWPLIELFGYISDGQREVCMYKPNAYLVLASTVLTASTTKQTLPAGGLQLLDVTRNMGANGTTAGNAIRVAAREVLDAQVPGWHSMTGDSVVKHYIYNPMDPTTFYVYPPQAATPHYVELLYGAVPAALTEPTPKIALADFASTYITLADIYANALVNYAMFRAYSKDAEYAANGALAQKYYELFLAAVANKTNVEISANPNQSMSGFNPNVPGSAK